MVFQCPEVLSYGMESAEILNAQSTYIFYLQLAYKNITKSKVEEHQHILSF